MKYFSYITKFFLFIILFSFFFISKSEAVIFNKKIDFDGVGTGANPYYTNLVVKDGEFFGVSKDGGENNYGVIFKYNPTSNIYSVLYNFISSGRKPHGSLVLYNNKFYGMNNQGGYACELASTCGTLFEFDPSNNSYTDKFQFTGENGSYEGSYPKGSLIVYNNELYGMTVNGGQYNKGVIFKYDPADNSYDILHEFDNTNGANPNGSLTLYNNKLYGVTSRGGSSDYGVLFTLDLSDNSFTKKFDFSGVSGSYLGRNPYGSLTLSNNKLYGVTALGGSGGGTGSGVLFEFDPAIDIYNPLYLFLNDNTGSSPLGDLVIEDGVIYGTTYYDGPSSDGVIYSFNLSGSSYNKLYSFSELNGNKPYGGLLFFGDKFYGLTSEGGFYDDGVLFEFDPFNTDNTNPTINDFDLYPTKISLSANLFIKASDSDSGIAGYYISETNEAPEIDNPNWEIVKPISYTFSSEGSKTLYLWVKDGSGNISNVSNASANITNIGDAVYVYNTSFGENYFSSSVSPSDIVFSCFSEDDCYFYVSTYSNTDDTDIRKFDSSGNYVDVISSPTSINKLYINRSGEFYKSLSTGIVSGGAYGFSVSDLYTPSIVGVNIAVDSNNNVYVADYDDSLPYNGNYKIKKFNRFGNFILEWGGSNEFGEFINDIDVDSNNNVYVLDASNDKIRKYNSSGVFQGELSLDSGVDSMFVDQSDNIYVNFNGFFKIYDSGFNLIFNYYLGTTFGGDGITVDYDGNVYTVGLHADLEKKISKFSLDNYPDVPSALSPSNGSSISDNTPTLSFTLSDPDTSDTISYQIQIDNNSDFSSPVVDYTSSLGAQGENNYTVSSSLSNGSYYWRVKSIDQYDLESDYVIANSGNIAFVVSVSSGGGGGGGGGGGSSTTVDKCSNIAGTQSSIPSGYTLQNGLCVTITPAINSCSNGMTVESNCTLPQTTTTPTTPTTPTTQTTNNSYTFSKPLKFGQNNNDGTEVYNLQKFLNSKGYTISLIGPGSLGNETNFFGLKTKEALIKFQLANNLTPDGVFGPATRAKVNELNNVTVVIQNPSPLAPPITTTTNPNIYTFSKPLKMGSNNNDVNEVYNLKVFLNTHGYPLALTGLNSLGNENKYFGLSLHNALIKFQQANNLTPDGIFGPKTREKVNELNG